MRKGSCLCGAVRFEVEGDLPAPSACHCSMCRKQSGHVFAAAEVPCAALTVHGEDHVTWYQSSAEAERGFCSGCGSTLFWKAKSKDAVAVAMGAFDGPTHTRLAMHIYVTDKGDYYELTDGLPQLPQA